MRAVDVLKGWSLRLKASVTCCSGRELVSTSSGTWRSPDRSGLRGQTGEVQNPNLKKRFCQITVAGGGCRGTRSPRALRDAWCPTSTSPSSRLRPGGQGSVPPGTDVRAQPEGAFCCSHSRWIQAPFGLMRGNS